jgi:hypothetical protein
MSSRVKRTTKTVAKVPDMAELQCAHAVCDSGNMAPFTSTSSVASKTLKRRKRKLPSSTVKPSVGGTCSNSNKEMKSVSAHLVAPPPSIGSLDDNTASVDGGGQDANNESTANLKTENLKNEKREWHSWASCEKGVFFQWYRSCSPTASLTLNLTL